MIDPILEAFKTHQHLFWFLGLGSIVLFVATALLIPWLIVLLPKDFFAQLPAKPFSGRHPVVAFLIIIFRNVVGAVLLPAGIIMLFTPGQGLLTILIALALIDFPGKHALLMRMISNPRLFGAANRIRRWAGKAEFLPAELELHDRDPSRPIGQRPDESIRND